MRRFRILEAISAVIVLALMAMAFIIGTPTAYKGESFKPEPAAMASNFRQTVPPSVVVSRSEIRPAIESSRRQADGSKATKVVGRYTVKGGDTLSQIAVDHHLRSWHPLAVANTDTIKNPDLIFIGQKLRVPTNGQVAKAPTAQTQPKRSSVAHIVVRQPIAVNGSPQVIARQLLVGRGWSSQWSCLNSLINRESGWNVHATNSGSGAYGIPQSLPGGKMASAGSNWRDSARTQLEWMMGYIHARYGSPCGAWGHSQATGWY